MKSFFLIIVATLFFIPVFGQEQPLSITVASFNIRMDTSKDGVNAWDNRKDWVNQLVQFYDFDVLGVQEGYIHQVKSIANLPNMAYYGRGRDDGKEAGEHSAIIYRKDKFQLLDSGDFWLSENPDVPGLGWDATCCNRICSWVKLKELKSGKVFCFFNVHFDHEGVVARVESGNLMAKKIKEIAKGSPIICTGDFNSLPDSKQIKTMKTVLNDCYEVSLAKAYGPVGTFSGFRYDAPMDKRIDYVFVSRDFTVLKYGVLSESKEHRFPSDHFPVMAKLEI